MKARRSLKKKTKRQPGVQRVPQPAGIPHSKQNRLQLFCDCIFVGHGVADLGAMACTA